MKMIRRIAAAVLALAFTAAAHAQYPNKPVKLIVPYPAGQATDIAARIIGEALSKEWGQPVVIDNIGCGAGWLHAPHGDERRDGREPRDHREASLGAVQRLHPRGAGVPQSAHHRR